MRKCAIKLFVKNKVWCINDASTITTREIKTDECLSSSGNDVGCIPRGSRSTVKLVLDGKKDKKLSKFFLKKFENCTRIPLIMLLGGDAEMICDVFAIGVETVFGSCVFTHTVTFEVVGEVKIKPLIDWESV